MADLLTHLRSGMATPFSRAAGADCCLWVADWIARRTGIDPAGPLRGAYRNGAGARRILRRFGGFEAMWRSRMRKAGFATTTDPREGDVGVIVDAAGRTVSAIRVHGAWAAKSRRGLVIEDFRMLVAWRISPEENGNG